VAYKLSQPVPSCPCDGLLVVLIVLKFQKLGV